MPWKVGRDRGAGAQENRGREKKGQEAGSLRWQEVGEKFKKASFRYLLLHIIHSKKRTQQLFLWLPFNILQGWKQNFVCKKSQETKIRTQDKKKTAFTSSEIGNLSKLLTW